MFTLKFAITLNARMLYLHSRSQFKLNLLILCFFFFFIKASLWRSLLTFDRPYWWLALYTYIVYISDQAFKCKSMRLSSLSPFRSLCLFPLTLFVVILCAVWHVCYFHCLSMMFRNFFFSQVTLRGQWGRGGVAHW